MLDFVAISKVTCWIGLCSSGTTQRRSGSEEENWKKKEVVIDGSLKSKVKYKVIKSKNEKKKGSLKEK